MRLAISNIAWGPDEEASIPSALRSAGAEAVEVAPGRLFADPGFVQPREISAVRARWQDAGLPIISMQALLFGRDDLRLLASPEETEDCVAYLSNMISLAGALGCGPLVFGSPKNRRKGALDFEKATERALPSLRRLGSAAEAAGCFFCLEANATDYGCDFMTVLEEAAAVVRAVDHPSVGLIADTGNMQMMGEAPDALAAVAPLTRHLQLSMPGLSPVTAEATFLHEALRVMYANGYVGDVSIEMRRLPDKDSIAVAAAAVSTVRHWIDDL